MTPNWRDLLPADRVVDDPQALRDALACTFAWPSRARALLAPETVDQVRRILQAAAAAGQAVYPYSRGMNWGLGSRLPTHDDCVLLDLSGMNRILGHDAALGTLTVEPGVHFAQAAAFLRREGSPFYCSVTGGPPYGSLVGNALERGGGDGPFGDRAAALSDIELVLSTGEIVHSGYSRFGSATLAGLSRTGVGPSLTELMAQSNLGVVTRATVWLARRPEHWALVRLRLWPARDGVAGASLSAATEQLRLLLQQGLCHPCDATLWSHHKLLSRNSRFALQPRAPIVPEALPWYLSLRLEGATPALLEAAIDHVSSVLSPVLSLAGRQDERDLQVLRDSQLAPDQRAAVEPGNPNGRNTVSVYWRKPGEVPDVADVDPDRDRCGVVWVCPALPLAGEVASAALLRASRRMVAAGFEPNVGATPVSQRLLHAYLALVYDRDEPGADERAMACHDALMADLAVEGHLPYRLGVQSMRALPRASDDSAALLGRLKHAFDPSGVMAPGRYEAAA